LPGYYFVTVCTLDRIAWFGEIAKGEMVLNGYGKVVQGFVEDMPEHYPNVVLDEWVIMPNHIHMIVVLDGIAGIDPAGMVVGGVGTEHCSVPTGSTKSQLHGGHDFDRYGLLSKVVKSFKNAVTKTIRYEMGCNNFGWQRSFHDHIIRDQKSLDNIRSYIRFNPVNWKEDDNYR